MGDSTLASSADATHSFSVPALTRPSFPDLQRMTVVELTELIRRASEELAKRATILQSTENCQRCIHGNKLDLSKAQSKDDVSSQQYGSLSVILNIPGLNTHLLSFSSATDLSRLSQCNRALQSMIDESFDLELERDVHLLQQLGMPSEKIAQFRGQWARLKNGEARIVCYLLCEGDLHEGNSLDLDFEHRSMVGFLRQFVINENLFPLYVDDHYDAVQIDCVECGRMRDDHCDGNFVSMDMSGSLSEGQFKCRDCFKFRDSSLMVMLRTKKFGIDWEFTENGPFDSTFEEYNPGYFESERAYPCDPSVSMAERMSRRSGMWLVNLSFNDCFGCPADWFIKLEDATH